MAGRVVILWSGGKDSTLALCEVQRSQEYEAAALLTTITRDYDRISVHGVRIQLLDRQAASLGLPLEKMFISKGCSNEEYSSKLTSALATFRGQGIEVVVAGDLFLEDIRRYREDLFREVGMRGVFPLWGRDTQHLASTFVAEGFEAVTVCVDSQALDASWAGRLFDEHFLADLPPGVDPCGENGEFHTFVYSGPPLKERVRWIGGEVILRDNRFYYCDLLPSGE